MADSFVIDTNVLIVASAAHDGSPFQPNSTPVQEIELRKQVLDWLQGFEDDVGRHVVLDWDWHICSEYQNKLNLEQDYGWLAIRSKMDRNEVVWVGFNVDINGHATLPDRLRLAVTDLEDRKMVAAVLAAKADGHQCWLVNACDTDWLDCSEALQEAKVNMHQLLPGWLQARRQRRETGQ